MGDKKYRLHLIDKTGRITNEFDNPPFDMPRVGEIIPTVRDGAPQ